MCCSGCLRGHVDVHTDAKTKTETKSRLGELGSGSATPLFGQSESESGCFGRPHKLLACVVCLAVFAIMDTGYIFWLSVSSFG